MNRLPFLPLYVNDFLGATTLWDGEEKGLYAILLILQWQSGPLPEDLAKLAKTAAYDLRKFRSLWKTVGKKFKSTPKGRINLRLEEHRDRAIEVHGQRVNNGKKGGRPPKLKKTERLSKRKANGSILLKLNESNSDIQILRSSDPQSSENHTSQAESKTVLGGEPPDSAPEFLQLKATYPKRAGDQRWKQCSHAISARLKEGHTWSDLLAGAQRYADFIRASDKEGSEFVKQAATFFGTDRGFLERWDAPKSKGERLIEKNIDATQQWLATKRAERADHNSGATPPTDDRFDFDGADTARAAARESSST